MVVKNGDMTGEHPIRDARKIIGESGSSTPGHKTRDGWAVRVRFIGSRCALPKPLLNGAAGF